jgi:hypothetical protein
MKSRGLNLANELVRALSRNMLTHKQISNNQSRKSFLVINFQLHILKDVK